MRSKTSARCRHGSSRGAFAALLYGLAFAAAGVQAARGGTGAGSPASAPSLGDVQALMAAGSFREAETTARRVLADTEAAKGADSLAASDAIDAVVGAQLRGRSLAGSDAQALAERSLRIRERLLGLDHLEVAGSLSTLGGVLAQSGNLAAARPLLERAVAIQERVGGDDSALARLVENLGTILRYSGDAASAKPLYERALGLRERALGPEHQDVAASAQNLAGLLVDLGDVVGAIPPSRRSLAIREKALGPGHPLVAMSLNGLGTVLYANGQHQEAKDLLMRAVRISEASLGADNLGVAEPLGNLANLLSEIGDVAGSRAAYERSLAITEAALGPDHPAVAEVLNNLATLDVDSGDLASGRRRYERALRVALATLGPEHPFVGSVLANFGNALRDLGDFTGARENLERALAIQRASLDPGHPAIVKTQHAMATLSARRGDLEEARRLFSEVAVAAEATFGPDHPELTYALEGLGDTLANLGRLELAQPLFERALRIREASLGPASPLVADSLRDLSMTARRRDDLATARGLAERMLAIHEAAFGASHPSVAEDLGVLAAIHLAGGAVIPAFDAAERAEGIGAAHARMTCRWLPEQQALSVAAGRVSELDPLLSMALANASPVPDAPHRAWDAVVRGRALVLDEMAARHHVAGLDVGGQDGELTAALAASRQRLAHLLVRGPGELPAERYRRILDDARNESLEAERALAERSATFRAEKAREGMGLDGVASALPEGSALLAFRRFLRSPVRGTEDAPPAEPVPSYVACVVRAGDVRPVLTALGAAEEIDRLVASWAAATARPGDASYRQAGSALRARVWDPIQPQVQGVERLFIVPDGALNLVSFATLPAADGRFLVETGPVLHHLSSERDLLHASRARPPGAGLLALGGADFDQPPHLALAVAATSPGAGGTAVEVAALHFRGQRSPCGEFASVRFAPLPATGREASEVASAWRRQDAAAPVAHLAGEAATESAVKRAATGQRVLHLATHGFFFGSDCLSAPEATRGVAHLVSATSLPTATGLAQNPLVLSGLALAGANHRGAARPDEDDGILTAEEIASLDLSACEWAVLSACNTGLGDIRAGEGVFGLRRAFQVAGASTLIMSLWSVDDEATRDWMRELYRARLARRLDSAECVREASLAVLRDRRAVGRDDSPFWWGAFVAAGDWR